MTSAQAPTTHPSPGCASVFQSAVEPNTRNCNSPPPDELRRTSYRSCPPVTITVHQGDTDSAPFGPGTGGSRSGPMIGQAVTEASLKYVNRLSDLLFVASRHANDKGKRDVLWVPGQNR